MPKGCKECYGKKGGEKKLRETKMHELMERKTVPGAVKAGKGAAAQQGQKAAKRQKRKFVGTKA